MKAKDKYVSPYNTELIVIGERSVVIQYLPTESKDYVIAVKKSILAKRPGFDDMKMTPYFETRCKNLVNKVYVCKTGAELVELLVKNCGVSMSSYFRYRDIIDIIKEKKDTMDFNETDSEVLGYIIKSLERNHVIAPKIKAIYSLLSGETCVAEE